MNTCKNSNNKIIKIPSKFNVKNIIHAINIIK